MILYKAGKGVMAKKTSKERNPVVAAGKNLLLQFGEISDEESRGG